MVHHNARINTNGGVLRGTPLFSFVLLCCGGCDRSEPRLTAPTSRDASAPSIAPTGCLEALSGEDELTRSIRITQERARQAPRDVGLWNELARFFVRRARATEDEHNYALAEDALRRALQVAPEDLVAPRIRALLLTQRHRFAEARELLRELLRRSPPSADVYGLLSDCALELGDYPAAEAAAQQMIDLRPDGQAYARVAWLRWLHGDGDGAEEVTRLALDALPRAPDGRAWIYTEAARLAFSRGQLELAEQRVAEALRNLPAFSAAHALVARLALARGQREAAESHARAALEAAPGAEHEALLADVLTALGRETEARPHYDAALRIGQRTDARTFAYTAARTGRELDAAVRAMREERERRPDVVSDEALAWVLFRAGQTTEALTVIERAMRLGTREPRWLFHRGLIRLAAGQAEGRTDLILALRQCPQFDPLDSREAMAQTAFDAGPVSSQSDAREAEITDGNSRVLLR